MSSMYCAHSGCANVINLADQQEQRLRDTHETFYCVMGHSNVFRGKTDSQRVKELEATIQAKDEQYNRATEWRDNTIRTLRGHITRIKRMTGLLPPKGKRRGHAR